MEINDVSQKAFSTLLYCVNNDVLCVITACLLGGGFGGLLAAISRARVPVPNKGAESSKAKDNANGPDSQYSDGPWAVIEAGIAAYGSWGRFAAICMLGASIGCGAALSLTPLFVLDDKVENLTPKNFLLILGLSVAAGFSGVRLLHKMSNRLESEVERQGQLLKNQQRELDELEKRAKQATAVEAHIAFGLSVLNSLERHEGEKETSKHRLAEALRLLVADVEHAPTDRRLGILIGRIYRELEQLDQSITALSECLARRRHAKLALNEDDAALLFNIACYNNLRAKALEKAQPEEAERLRKVAWENLLQAAKLDDKVASDLRLDPDLKGLENQESRAQSELLTQKK
jgi:hypothetical protein